MNLTNLAGTVSKAAQYVIIVLAVIYTIQSYTVFAQRNRMDREQIFLRQNVSMFAIHFLAYLIMYLNTMRFDLLLFYGAQVLFLMFTLLLYRNLYPRASKSLINNMCMLLSVGFIMITRLSYDQSVASGEMLRSRPFSEYAFSKSPRSNTSAHVMPSSCCSARYSITALNASFAYPSAIS